MTSNPTPDRRAEISAHLWQIAEQHIVAEWICCEPLEPRHDLCAKGYAALGMAKTLLVDSDPEKAWNPTSPVLDAVMQLLAAPAAVSSAVGQATRDRIAEILRPHASLGGTPPRYEVPLFDGATPSLPRISGWRPLDEVVDALAVLLLPAPADRAAEIERLREQLEEAEDAAEQLVRNVQTVARERESYRKAWKEEQQRRVKAEAEKKPADRLRAVVARVAQMADAWEQQLPEVIRTPAVVSAIRAALEAADDPSRLADEAQQSAVGARRRDTETHVYLSTGCLHGQHEYCQNTEGVAGPKKPAQCKFCTTRCVCGCHAVGARQPDTQTPDGPLRAELKPWQLLGAEEDGPVPQTERLTGGRRLAETQPCPDPIECSHEAALGQAQQEARRLGLMVDEYSAGASALTDKLKRLREWVTSDVVTARNEFGSGYREAQRDIRDLLDGRAPTAGGAGGVADETGEGVAPVHAVPLPGSNGISACCGRPPCEFVGERVTRDPDAVTCPGPAASSAVPGRSAATDTHEETTP